MTPLQQALYVQQRLIEADVDTKLKKGDYGIVHLKLEHATLSFSESPFIGYLFTATNGITYNGGGQYEFPKDVPDMVRAVAAEAARHVKTS